MKTCTKCKVEQDLSQFKKHKRGKDGIYSHCNTCVSTYRKQRHAQVGGVTQTTDSQRKYQKLYREENRDRIRAYNKAYDKKNRALKTARNAKYKASKRQAAPKWLSKEQLNEIKHKYLMCSEISSLKGTLHHVDHIHPLKGELLCGLHVPWNLRIILAVDNIRKGNRFIA